MFSLGAEYCSQPMCEKIVQQYDICNSDILCGTGSKTIISLIPRPHFSPPMWPGYEARIPVTLSIQTANILECVWNGTWTYICSQNETGSLLTLMVNVSTLWSRSMGMALLRLTNSALQSRSNTSCAVGRSRDSYCRQWLIRSCMSGHGGHP